MPAPASRTPASRQGTLWIPPRRSMTRTTSATTRTKPTGRAAVATAPTKPPSHGWSCSTSRKAPMAEAMNTASAAHVRAAVGQGGQAQGADDEQQGADGHEEEDGPPRGEDRLAGLDRQGARRRGGAGGVDRQRRGGSRLARHGRSAYVAPAG